MLLVAIGAAAALGVAAIWDERRNHQDGVIPKATPHVPRPDPQEHPEAAELYDLVVGFTELTLHARYRVTVTGDTARSAIMEVWQKDGKVRQEAFAEGQDGRAGKALILNLEDRVVLCQQPPGGQYTCGLVSETQKTAFESLRSSLLAQIVEQPVSAKDDTIDGRPVRCFSVASGPSELCASTDGVLVRVTAPEGSFELLEFDTDVDDSLFVPPATPGART